MLYPFCSDNKSMLQDKRVMVMLGKGIQKKKEEIVEKKL